MAPSTEKGEKGGGGDAPKSSYDDMEETLIRVASAKSLVDLSKSGSLDAASAEIDQSSNAMQTSPQGSPKAEVPASVRPTPNTQTSLPAVNRQIDSATSGTGVDVGAVAAAAASSALSSSVAVTTEQTNKALPTVAPKPIAPAGQPTSQTGSSTIPPAGATSRSSPTSSSVPSSRQPTSGSTRPTRSTKSKGTALRRGKWTPEEEAYVARVIHDFNTGFLNAPAGTTLRSYLSEKLQCDPMRITKKFTGDSCIGKRVFHPAIRSDANANLINTAQAELVELEKKWRRRLELQQRESAKKAAASAAVANAANPGSAARGSASIGGAAIVQGVPVAMLGVGSQGLTDRQSAVDQAASWLDRANAILKGSAVADTSAAMMFRDSARSSSSGSDSSDSHNIKEECTQSSGDSSLENQMEEVQRLINEGSGIQQATAGLPNLLLQQTGSSTAASPHAPNSGTTTPPPEPSTMTSKPSPSSEPVDKRLRTVSNLNAAGTEDAEALVGFLRSVRASAAAGEDH